MAKNKKGMSFGKKVMIGAGVAAVGAGAYYLMGPNGKKNQKKAKVWINKMGKKAVKEIAIAKKEYKIVEKKAKPAIKQAKKSVKKTIRIVKKLSTKRK